MISRISRRLSTHIRARTHTSIHNRTLSLNSNLIKAAENDPASYCKEHVRKHDYESFLTGQFYPRDIQAVYFALRAFYVELAMIQDTVSESTLGKMRMQFWRDTIKQISDGRPPRHPIALALFEASRRVHIPVYHMRRIVDARDEELQAPPHLTLETLTTHAESTSSTFIYTLLSALSLPSSSLAHAASHLGAAQTLATLLRALPFHAARGRMVIPAEITAKHGVSMEEVFRAVGGGIGKAKETERQGEWQKDLEDAVFEFATVANDHLITARDVFKDSGGRVPIEAMPVFLTAIPVAHFLERLEAANFNVFDTSLQLRDWKLPWRVWRGFYKRSF